MRIIIIGGGVAGLTAALALARRGLSCEVFEAGARDRDQGAGVMLAPNGLATLRRLDLSDQVRRAGFEPRSMIIARSDGRILQRVDADEWRRRYGFGPVAIHRGALHRLLVDALHGLPLRYDTAVAGLRDEANESLAVALANGERITGELVIAADGLRSHFRQQLFGPTRFRYAGQTSWRGICEHRLDGEFGQVLLEMWGRPPGLRFGVVPVDERRSYWFATQTAPPGGEDPSMGATLDRLGADFADFAPSVQIVLRHTQTLIRTDILDFAPLPSWHRGRVVLIGDAAHATTPNLGQGANQAIESAFVVAQALADEELPAALTTYERIRMPKAHWVTRQSWRYGHLTNLPGALGRFVRHTVVARTPRALMQKQTDRLFSLGFR
jgi:2-polyprenyl-6-methoxyphenol hydroxylase-like FAD-dependent oxidoreductase